MGRIGWFQVKIQLEDQMKQIITTMLSVVKIDVLGSNLRKSFKFQQMDIVIITSQNKSNILRIMWIHAPVDKSANSPDAVSTASIGHSQEAAQPLLPQDVLRGAWPYKNYIIIKKVFEIGMSSRSFSICCAVSGEIQSTPLTSLAQSMCPFQSPILKFH